MNYYAPLNVLKPIGTDIWLVDGPTISFFGLPFTTRMTVIRLQNGDLFLHSPTILTDALRHEIEKLGRVAHLVSPNWIHYSYIANWSAAFPEAKTWASPNVRKRAKKYGNAVVFSQDLTQSAPPDWAGQIEQMIVRGSRIHKEVVFFHRRSNVLVLTDLIENFETEALPKWFRPIARLVGVAHPDGKMPIDMWLTFRAGRKELAADVHKMFAWKPVYIVVAHGKCFEHDCEAELRRAFRRALR